MSICPYARIIPETDKQLYQKYNLWGNEISFNEEQIKPME